MAKLKFDTTDLLRTIDHALASPVATFEWGGGERDNSVVPKAAIILVKDEGIYVMSAGSPRDIVEGQTSFTTYAKGFDPTKDDRGDVWDKCREAVGGDDFGDYLVLDDDVVQCLREGGRLEMNVTPNQISVTTVSTPSREATEVWLRKHIENGTVVFKTPRHKRITVWKPDVTVERIKASFPKAVILNAMKFDDAVDAYLARQS